MWYTYDLENQTFTTKMEYEQIESITVKYYNPKTNKHTIIEHYNFENVRDKEHEIKDKLLLIGNRNGNPMPPIPNGMELSLNIDCKSYTTTIKEED